MRLVGLIGVLGLLGAAGAAVAEDAPPSAALAAECANGANRPACEAFLAARGAEVRAGDAGAGEPAADPDAQAAAARQALGPMLEGAAAPAGGSADGR